MFRPIELVLYKKTWIFFQSQWQIKIIIPYFRQQLLKMRKDHFTKLCTKLVCFDSLKFSLLWQSVVCANFDHGMDELSKQILNSSDPPGSYIWSPINISTDSALIILYQNSIMKMRDVTKYLSCSSSIKRYQNYVST